MSQLFGIVTVTWMSENLIGKPRSVQLLFATNIECKSSGVYSVEKDNPYSPLTDDPLVISGIQAPQTEILMVASECRS